jgi:hypothetical protein
LDGSPSVKRRRMVTIDPNDLIGRTFLKDSEEDGQRFRARVVRAVIDKEDVLKKGSEYMKFICEVPNSTVDEILTYNEILITSKGKKMRFRMTRNNFSSFGASPLIKVLYVHLTKITRAQHSMC